MRITQQRSITRNSNSKKKSTLNEKTSTAVMGNTTILRNIKIRMNKHW